MLRHESVVVFGLVTEILEGLDDANRDRVRALRGDGRFFWLDVSLSDASRARLGDVLGIEEPALRAMMGFGETLVSSRKFYADGRRVVFGFSCYVEAPQVAHETRYRLRPVEVRLLFCREYVLTLHEERVSLPELVAPHLPGGRSEQYVVYAILDALVASAFDALREVELRMDGLAAMSTDLRGGRVRIATLRALSAQLSGLRRQVGPQRGLFERIGVEVGWLAELEGGDERYFDRIGDQVSRLVSAIDAAANAMATMLDLRLNETIYWLTVVATIFLPLTFITGFFGMNFGWMVGQINTQLAFWLLGIGSLGVGVALIWRLVLRAAPVDAGHDDS
jgi:magnesium transporter